MGTLQAKLEGLVKAHLQEGQADLETLPNGHVCGHIISSEFKGVSYEERRLRVKQLFEANLKADDLANVSTLLTYTPEEWSFEPKES